MKIQPLDDRVLVQPDVAEEKTASGIYLPDSAREKPQTGKIVATGPGRLNEDGERTAMEVKVGDKVLYGKYAGTEVDIDGTKHVLMRESELLAVVD